MPGPYAGPVAIRSVLTHGYRLRLVDAPAAFDRDGIYGFDDDPWRFGLLGRAALETLRVEARSRSTCSTSTTGTRPPAGPARPVLRRRPDRRPRPAGLDPDDPQPGLPRLGRPGRPGQPRAGPRRPGRRTRCRRDRSAVGRDRTGRTWSIPSVPTFAAEALTPAVGFGLDPTLRWKAGQLDLAGRPRFFGILNGIDPAVWDPADGSRPGRAVLDRSDLTGKAACRADLLDRVGFDPGDDGPVLGMIGRLDPQKGFDLLAEAAPRLLESGARLIVQGSGDPALAEPFRALARRRPDRIVLNERFDRAMARRIYAGADLYADAQPVRAVRPGPDDRPALRDAADRPPDGRPGRHGRRRVPPAAGRARASSSSIRRPMAWPGPASRPWRPGPMAAAWAGARRPGDGRRPRLGIGTDGGLPRRGSAGGRPGAAEGARARPAGATAGWGTGQPDSAPDPPRAAALMVPACQNRQPDPPDPRRCPWPASSSSSSRTSPVRSRTWSEALAERGVDLRAIGGGSMGETGHVIMTTADDDGARAVLEAGGYTFIEGESILAEVGDRPGGMAGVTRELCRRRGQHHRPPVPGPMGRPGDVHVRRGRPGQGPADPRAQALAARRGPPDALRPDDHGGRRPRRRRARPGDHRRRPRRPGRARCSTRWSTCATTPTTCAS